MVCFVVVCGTNPWNNVETDLKLYSVTKILFVNLLTGTPDNDS